MSAIAKSYWRRIQWGPRTFDAIPDSVKDEVRALAHADVENGTLDREEYRTLIGENFPGE